MVDVTDIAPDAVESREDKDHIWRFLVYGNPGTGKTHCGFTCPPPVVCIDTEGKAHSIVDKFDQQVVVLPAENYDEAVERLGQAFDILERALEEEGKVGTVMVDSISDMWDMAQQKYLQMAYPGRDRNEVNLQSALRDKESGGDWQSIKNLHNDRFREKMLEHTVPVVRQDDGSVRKATPHDIDDPSVTVEQQHFNVFWTAKSKEDYGAILSGKDVTPAKDEGEKDNRYRVTELVHFIEGEEGQPVANLKKTALTKWNFAKLEWPTFPKMREVIETVAEAEASEEQYTVGDIIDLTGYDIELYEGDPDIVLGRQGEMDVDE